MTQELLLLTAEEIRQVVPMSEFLRAAEESFVALSTSKACLAPKFHMDLPTGGFVGLLAAYVETADALAIKTANVRPENPKRRGLSYSYTQVFLYDRETGLPLALMNGDVITELRTGAAGGLAAKYLAPKHSRVVGIVGAGRQARSNLLALLEVMDVEKVLVFTRSPEAITRFVADARQLTDSEIVAASLADVVAESDVLVTTTPSTSPIIKRAWVHAGHHINALGADHPTKQELEPNILSIARVITDHQQQCIEFGEVRAAIAAGVFSADQIAADLGQVVTGERPGRVHPDDITVFDSTGVGTQDAVAARFVYDLAVSEGVGRMIRL